MDETPPGGHGPADTPPPPPSAWSPPAVPGAPTWAGTGWGPPPAPKPRSRRTLWIVLGIVAVLLILLVGSCALMLRDFGSNFGPAAAVMNASNGRITSFRVDNFNGQTTMTFQAARGLDLADGPSLACDVVKPTLETTAAQATEWVIVNRAGDVIGSNKTPCP
jgi:hypothetical protein